MWEVSSGEWEGLVTILVWVRDCTIMSDCMANGVCRSHDC